MNKIVNIVNFVRGAEPRKVHDLYEAVYGELELVKKHNFPNTFLLQYDALIDGKFQDIFKTQKDDNMEIGIWIECVRQLVEECGLEWRGDKNVTWDWHIIPGFLMAYTQEERKLMVDEFMRKFRKIFGYYPKTVGSWLLDSYSIAYMQEAYDVDAFLICREQYGVDAYTVWGGYPNQGYYPAKNNMMCPAQSEENKVNAPVFKMLGPDPVYNYNEKEFDIGMTGCPTMEPYWDFGYQKNSFLSNINAYYKEECMDFAYTTIGQENSFKWSKVKDGLAMQMEILDQMQRNGEIIIQKTQDTGKWFKENIKDNSVISLISHSDWANIGVKSIWYACKNYRANLFADNGKLYFRDIFKFDERYSERYLDTPCQTMTAFYDNLPVVDGRLWNCDGVKSGLKFVTEINEIKTEKNNDTLLCTAQSTDGQISVEFNQSEIVINKPETVSLIFERGTDFGTAMNIENKCIKFAHNGFEYKVEFSTNLKETDLGYEINEQTSIVKIILNRR